MHGTKMHRRGPENKIECYKTKIEYQEIPMKLNGSTESKLPKEPAKDQDTHQRMQIINVIIVLKVTRQMFVENVEWSRDHTQYKTDPDIDLYRFHNGIMIPVT